jgi:hypothetical protein
LIDGKKGRLKMENNAQLVITSKNYLEVLNAKLTPYRVQYPIDGTILYEFWKVAQTPGQKWKNTPKTRDCEKELAMLSIKKGKTIFSLHYYPLNKEIQVIHDLPIERLQEAINLLNEAGF